MAGVDLEELYLVLRSWAVVKPGQVHTYGELSQQYRSRTGDWFEPHGSWDSPLGALNQRLDAVGAPPLSALVVLQGSSEPGGGFWGSAPSVPQCPRADLDRLAEWSRLVSLVHAYAWPAALP
jgi:hypothetical protein